VLSGGARWYALALTGTISYHLESIALPHCDDKEMVSKSSSKPRVTSPTRVESCSIVMVRAR
jgi:hypothetical protein